MTEELNYNRHDIRRRHKIYIKSIERWMEDVESLISLLIENKHEDKAKDWGVLYNSLSIIKDLWTKLVDEL
ncbi:MAG: hypothetical protein QXI68_02245 [Sulfolobales archaeon]